MAKLSPLIQAQNNNLLQRLLTIALVLPVVIFTFLQGTPYIDILIMSMLGGMLWEWNRMSIPSVSWPILSIILGMWCFLTFYGITSLTVLLPGFVLLLSAHIMHHRQHPVSVKDRTIHYLGMIYIGLSTYILMTWIKTGASSFVLWLLLIVWASDTGAYITGRIFRGPKLVPRISPGKTWSGFIGGTLIGALVGTMVASYLIPHTMLVSNHGYAAVLGISFILSLSAHAGDLLESQAKRHFRVKDSGSLFPGHGGILDRLDSTLMVLLVSGGLLIFYPQLF